jgi:cobalamin biosynthesis protein CobT
LNINPRVIIVRQAISKIVEMLAIRKIRVTQQGVTAYVRHDPVTAKPIQVNIPYLPDDATDALIEATQGFLDHEVGHLLFSDFTDLNVVCARGDRKFQTLVNIVEDTYVERKMRERFTGTAANLSSVLSFLIEKHLRPAIEEARAKGDNNRMMEILLMPMFRAMADQALFRDFMKEYGAPMAGVIAALGPDFPKLLNAIESTKDSVNVAEEFMKRLKSAASSCPTPDSEKGEKGESSSKSKKGSEEKKDKKKGESGKGSPETDSEEEGDKESEKEEKGKSKGEKEEKEGKDEKEEKGGDGSEKGAEGDAEDEGESGTDEGESPGSSEEGEEGEEAGEAGSDGDGADGEKDEGAEKGESGKSSKPAAKKNDQEMDDDSPPEVFEQDTHHTDDFTGAPGDADSGVAQEKDTSAEQMLGAIERIKEDFDDMAARVIGKEAESEMKDTPYKVWSTDYDVIKTLAVKDDFATDYECQRALKNMTDKVDHMVGPMQKDIERAVAARSAAVYTSGFRSGKLHGPSLHRITAGRDDLFRRKQENRTKDVAVELVVDASGSMYGKIDIASYAAYALSSVLDRLQIVNEVVAFSTKGFPGEAAKRLHEDIKKVGSYSRHEAIVMPILKEFDERLTPIVRERFATLAHFAHGLLQSNVDGESVLMAYSRLIRRRESRKIMIVLSDGRPAAAGDMHALEHHLKSVVKEIERSGTNVVGIGIQDDSVKRFYKKHVILSNVEDLPGEVLRRLKAMLMPDAHC